MGEDANMELVICHKHNDTFVSLHFPTAYVAREARSRAFREAAEKRKRLDGARDRAEERAKAAKPAAVPSEPSRGNGKDETIPPALETPEPTIADAKVPS